jgi:hypothetical protein
MARIRVCELQEQLAHLPDIELLDVATEMKGRSADLLLCALGFEPRCLTLPEALAGTGLVCERAIYFEYQSNPLENDANRTALVSHLTSISPSVESMDADGPDFTQRLRSLFENLSRSDVAPRVIVDISVFGNRLAFKLYAVLLEARIDVTLVYAEAAVYRPTHDEYLLAPEKWGAEQEFGLERGVSSIAISPEHPGQFLDLLPDFVMVLPAFSPDRSRAALEWVDPSLVATPDRKVMWFVGDPHHTADRWRLEAVKAHHGITEQAQHVEVSTFFYKDALRVLHGACENNGERYNLTLVPLGSKCQALGAALCCFIHPEVRVLFAVPRAYNAATYSEGTKAIWKIEIGSIESLRSKLLDVGTLQVVDDDQADTDFSAIS